MLGTDPSICEIVEDSSYPNNNTFHNLSSRAATLSFSSGDVGHKSTGDPVPEPTLEGKKVASAVLF